MEYRVSPKTGKEVSLLGFGAMRLPSSRGSIDYDLSRSLFEYAIDNGVNYIDTAYLYGNGSGSNERVVGEALESLGYRDKVFISTKMNRMAISSREDMEVMFSNQLSNLRTDYIDYYFIHNVISYDDVSGLIDLGLLDFIREKKSSGEIINMGFSFHGSYDDFVRILDLYDWDVTLLQYNLLDDNIQAGIRGIRLASSRDMAVVIMEPLKGGLLAGDMPVVVEDLVKSRTERSNVDLALNWIYDTYEITTVLSGMNSMEMLEENINITSTHKQNPLNDDELKLVGEIKELLLKMYKIDCTSCGYCMPCPKQVNIPDIFKFYNDKNLFPDDKSFGMHHAQVRYIANILGAVGQAHDPSLCVDCGLCLKKCPQQLEIPKLIRQVDKSFHAGFFRKMMPVIKKIMSIVM